MCNLTQKIDLIFKIQGQTPQNKKWKLVVARFVNDKSNDEERRGNTNEKLRSRSILMITRRSKTKWGRR